MPKYGGGQILPIYPQFIKTSCLTVQAINRVGLTIYNTDATTPLFKVDTSTNTVTLNGTLSGTTMRLSLIDGTVSNPALKFQNSTTTGIYLSATNQMSIATAGAEALRCDASGNTTVLGNLVVNGTSTTVNSSVVNVSDNIINVGSGNVADSLDLGMCFQYVSSGTKYGALYRVSGTDNWYLKNAISSAPGNTVSGGTLANLYVGKIVPTSFQMETGAASSYVLASDGSGNGTWTAVSALGVSSLTGTANQVIVSSATGAVTLSTPQSIGTSSTPQFARMGLGVASASNVGLLINPTFSSSSSIGNALSITGGTITVTESSSGIKNINSSTTVLATGSSGLVSLFYHNINANNSLVTKTGDGTFSAAYGIYSDGFVSIANSQYAGYFLAPTGGVTNNTALFTTNLSVGSYGTTTPPSNGAIISGNVGIGTSAASNLLTIGTINTALGEAIKINGNSSQNYLAVYNNTTRAGYVGTGASGLGLTVNSDNSNLVLQASSTNSILMNTNGSTCLTINSSGQVGIGGLDTSYLFTINGGNAVIEGSIIAAATSKQGLYITPVFATSGNTPINAALQIYPAMRPTGGTVSNAYGLVINAGDQSGAVGTITNGYGLAVEGCSFGTTRYGLAVNTPTGGTNNFCAYFQGNVGIGTTHDGSSFVRIHNSVNRYGLNVSGTNTVSSNGYQLGIVVDAGFSSAVSTTYMAGIWVTPYFVAGSATTTAAGFGMYIANQVASNVGIITTAAGLYIDSGSAGAGTITNAFGLYVRTPAHGTTKQCAYFDGRVEIGGSITANTLFGINGTTTYQYFIDWRGTCAPSTGYAAGFNVGMTLSPTAACTYADQMSIYPQWNASGGTITNARGLIVSGGATTGGTITNAWSLYVDPPLYGTNRYAGYFGGNVGINQTAPGQALELGPGSNIAVGHRYDGSTTTAVKIGKPAGSGTMGTADGSFYILFQDSFSADVNKGGSLCFYTHNWGVNTGERMRVSANGNVGIGTTTPAYQLELSTNSAGKPTSTTWTVTSDRRIKTDIQDAPLAECMALIDSLRVCVFKYNPIYAAHVQVPETMERYGLIAQEVEEVAPYCVTTIPKAKYTNPTTGESYELENLKTLDVDELNYAVIASVKYLSGKNAALGDSIVELKTKDGQLDNAIVELGTKDAQLGSSISALEAKDAQLGSSISALAAKDAQLGNSITALEAKDVQLGNSITALEAKDVQLGNSITALEAKDRQLNNSIDTLGTKTTQLDNFIAELKIKDVQLDSSIAVLEAKNIQTIDALKAKDTQIAILETKDIQLDRSISELKTKDIQLDIIISTLEVKNAQLDGSITVLKVSNDQLTNTIDTLKAKDIQIENFILALEAKGAQFESDITALKAMDTHLDSSIAALSANDGQINSSIITLGAKDVQLANSITTLEAKDVQLANSITALETKDVQLDNSISTLSTRIGALETIASSLSTRPVSIPLPRTGTLGAITTGLDSRISALETKLSLILELLQS